MTVVTELASEAGVFLWTAHRFRHWGRGYSFLLWLFLAVFATLSTIFLSLDTTAVLLTPVVVSVTRQAGLPPLPWFWCPWSSSASSSAATSASAIHGSRSGGSGRTREPEDRRRQRRTGSCSAAPRSSWRCCCRPWCPGSRSGSPPWRPPLCWVRSSRSGAPGSSKRSWCRDPCCCSPPDSSW
ncbi:MAG: SLC13 family permease [Pseudarthrobacter sp.]